MSASLVFSSAAPGRPFIFLPSSSPRSTAEKKARNTAQILAQLDDTSKLAAVVPASGLKVRSAPEMVSSGIPQLDSLTGGIPRGCLTEICGAASSGRTSVLLCALARATQRGEVCALVDASNAFDPASAAHAGMKMSHLLWVRCGEKFSSEKRSDAQHDLYQGMPSGISQDFREGRDFSRTAILASSSPALAAVAGRAAQPEMFLRWRNPRIQRQAFQLEQVLKVTDLLLQSNGFGMIAIDLGDIPAANARRIPLVSWFRFRRAIEHTPTALLVLEQQPIAGSCSSLLVKVSGKKPPAVRSQLSGNALIPAELPHSELLDQFEITIELLRSRVERKLERKPVQSTASFRSRAAWRG